MKTNVPNLDDFFSIEELKQFFDKHSRGGNHLSLFPEGGKGTKIATNDLANYAINKAVARELRTNGSIQDAIMYERICDTIYNGLPSFAKW